MHKEKYLKEDTKWKEWAEIKLTRPGDTQISKIFYI